MNRDKPLTKRQAVCIIAFFVFGSSAVMGGSSDAGQDSWIAIAAAMAMAVPLTLMFARILRLYPQTDVFDIMELVFGRVAGKIVAALLSTYALALAGMVLKNYAYFFQISSMPETPQYAMLALMAPALMYLASKGVQALGKWSAITFPIVLLVLLFTIVTALNQMDFSNILPVMGHSAEEIGYSTWSLFTFPFAETVLFMALAPSLKKEVSPYKTYLLGILIGGLSLLAIALRNLFILDVPMMKHAYFPSYTAVRMINIGDFFSRMEGLIASNFFLGGLTKAAVCLIFAAKGTAKLLNVENYKKTIVPLGLAATAIGVVIYPSIMNMYGVIYLYAWVAPFFQVLLPSVLWLGAEIRSRKRKALT